MARTARAKRARTTSRPKRTASVRLPKPKSSKPRRTRVAGATVTTRARRGKAKGGQRTVARIHSKARPTFGRAQPKTATNRKATVKTRGGLTRTATSKKTVTGTGAKRVAKTRRVVTRVKNGRTVKRVVTRVNRGGKVTVKRSAPKVTGHTHIPVRKPKNPKVKHMPGTRTGGTSAPRRTAKRGRRK